MWCRMKKNMLSTDGKVLRGVTSQNDSEIY